jgi:anti-anti-sigma factor
MHSASPAPVLAQMECVRGVPVLIIRGRLDASNAALFDEQVAPFLAQNSKPVLMDLSGILYISSAGLRSFILIIKHTALQGGRAGIFSVPAYVLELIEISGIAPLIDIYSDCESALNGSTA